MKISSNDESVLSLNKNISNSRTFVMGMAMLMVMLFHETYDIVELVDVIFSFCGLWGVDVFLFASGFGIYYSLNSKREIRLKDFYIKRLLRIMPAAIIAGVILFIFSNAGKLAILGLNMWYIRTILIYYALSPLIYRSLMKYKPTLVLLVGVCVSSILYLISIPVTCDESLVVKTVIAWTLGRFPAFLLGMYIARVNWSLKKVHNVYCFIFSIIAICLASYMRYEIYIEGNNALIYRLWTIPLAFFIPMFFELCNYVRKGLPSFLLNIISFFGFFSLEIYLIHEFIFRETMLLNTNIYLKSVIGFGGSIFLAWLLSYIAKYVQKFCTRILIK